MDFDFLARKIVNALLENDEVAEVRFSSGSMSSVTTYIVRTAKLREFTVQINWQRNEGFVQEAPVILHRVFTITEDNDVQLGPE